jgi:type I restriction enzyme R subunit
MPPTDRTRWDELSQSEEPAALLLQRLGWAFVPAEELDAERSSPRDALLLTRLENAIRRLNPWISAENVGRILRELGAVQAASLTEANEKLHIILTYGATARQDIGDGLGIKDRPVRLLDFEDPAGSGNEFVFTRQFPVKNVRGLTALPDIVLFVNGIPLAVIECKSPKITEPITEGIGQLLRYQELEDRFEHLGMPKLFETIQVVAVICGVGARFGTVGTPSTHWGEWKVPYPLTLDEFQKREGDPTAQNVALYGLFRRDNFLDLIRNFIVFEVDDGRLVKKLARYQQFIAVNRAIARIQENEGPERGGVVWHTQGSGKSLTMVYMALKLRRMTELENPTIVIVTDRTDLDRQITGTFQNCGFPNPEQANRISHLKQLLASHSGKTILTTVQKFGGINERLADGENVFVMVDEAHRTQYKSLAARMRQALPNACFLGFTGTPIDKKDRSTFATFGPYIHTYTIDEAVKDGATVPIFYETKLADLHIAGGTIDQVFERVFKDRTQEEREEIKRRYATEEALAGAPSRIRQICLDLIEHFEKFIYPNGYKAQVVAANREIAVLYKETLDRLLSYEGAPKTALIMSIGHNDPKRYRDATVPKDRQKVVTDDQFKKKGDPLAILIVCDMLITGFDAPIEQVMYLDSPLREHTLLQAIARVNRISDDKKTYGLIVDYWGISRNLQDALSVFNPADVANALRPKSDELPRLESRHQTVMRFFHGVKKNDMEACLKVIEPEDVRAEFDQAFRRFAASLDMVLPDPAALRFTADLRWLGDLRATARNRFRDDTFDLDGCGEKVRQMIEEHVQSSGVRGLMEPVSVFSHEFDEAVGKLSSPEAKASEMEHALRHEISVRLEENPVFYKSLRERLEALIEARRRAQIDAAEQLKLFGMLREEMLGAAKKAESMGMTEEQFAFCSLLDGALPLERARDLAGAVLDTVKPLAVIDWQSKEDVQREMRRQVKRLLRVAGIKDGVEETTSAVIDLARVRLRV